MIKVLLQKKEERKIWVLTIIYSCRLGTASKLGSQEQPKNYQGVGSEKFENDISDQREQVRYDSSYECLFGMVEYLTDQRMI